MSKRNVDDLLTQKQAAMLDRLIAIGVVGETRDEAVQWLIAKGLDDYVRAGVLR